MWESLYIFSFLGADLLRLCSAPLKHPGGAPGSPRQCYVGGWQRDQGSSSVPSTQKSLPAAAVSISWSCAHWEGNLCAWGLERAAPTASRALLAPCSCGHTAASKFRAEQDFPVCHEVAESCLGCGPPVGKHPARIEGHRDHQQLPNVAWILQLGE